jgi:hypothetical protein
MDKNREEENRGYGANFGKGARPYGEDYGEDSGDDSNAQSRYDTRNRRQSGGPADYRRGRQDWLMDDAGFDYGMSRTGSYSRVGGFHFSELGVEDDRTNTAERRRGYSSDHDRGTPHYSRNRGNAGERGFMDRGYSEEDIPTYRHRYRSSNYPDTYRSAMGGYMSEFVGDDAGRSMPGQMGRGSHRGKGPRNYKRSDERIREEVNDRLTDDPFVDCSNVEVSVQQGEVVLTGSVVDKTAKRRVEDIAGSVRGVRDVENRLRRGGS